MDTFLQSPRTMVNAVFAEAAKEQQSVTAAALVAAAAAVTTSLQQEAASSSPTTTTTNNSTNLDTTTTNPSNIDTNHTGNGAADDNASVATNSSSSSKRAKNSNNNNNNNSKTNAAIDKVDNFRARMDSLWKNAKTEADLENAFKKTMHLATKQTESMIREGRAAFHLLETLTRSHALLQDELESKNVELQRLLAAEEKSRSSITNLIRAVETSKVGVRDSSRSALNEAALRAELANVTTKQKEALGVAEEYKCKESLLEQELGQVKMKLLRATQEKATMERDQRAVLSLAKSMNQYHSGGSAALSSSGADVEYYKRKVAELNGRLQGMTGVLAEKERQSSELRSQIEGSMSKNRLAELRASKTTTGGRKRPL